MNVLLIRLTAVSLVLSFSTVILAVTAENPGNAATWIRALKLAGQTHVDVCREEIKNKKEPKVRVANKFSPKIFLKVIKA